MKNVYTLGNNKTEGEMKMEVQQYFDLEQARKKQEEKEREERERQANELIQKNQERKQQKSKFSFSTQASTAPQKEPENKQTPESQVHITIISKDATPAKKRFALKDAL